MWSAVVALPPVQAEFGIDRANASLPFTLALTGFAFGGALMGRLADRFGIVVPVIGGAVMLGVGYVVSGFAATLWQFAAAYGVIGVGSSATFAPLMADISHWFTRRRGIAVAIASCSSYLAGTVWPPIVQSFIASAGWRQTHIGVGVLCVVTMLPLTFLALRPLAPLSEAATTGAASVGPQATLGLSPTVLQTLLMIAGVCCCVTMVTPQVQIVAYCGDLGYGPARGAEMLSLMLGLGVISRLVCGLIADRIGGLKTLFLVSTLQAVTVLPYITFDGLASLYVTQAHSAFSRAASYRCMRSSCESIFYRKRQARASGSWSEQRCSAWRSADGCRERSSTSRARIEPRLSTPLSGTFSISQSCSGCCCAACAPGASWPPSRRQRFCIGSHHSAADW